MISLPITKINMNSIYRKEYPKSRSQIMCALNGEGCVKCSVYHFRTCHVLLEGAHWFMIDFAKKDIFFFEESLGPRIILLGAFLCLLVGLYINHS